MPKPTEEIIECACRLRTLGVKKEPEVGDWTVNDFGEPILIMRMDNIQWAKKKVTIPPLEWCLEWLRKNLSFGRVALKSYDGSRDLDEGEWVASGPIGWDVSISEQSNSPHLAVLKAMIAVVKEKQ